jgi:hypothetical protein
MKRFLAVFALVLVAALAPAPAGAGATHTSFTGGIGIVNPCNGEVVIGTGPVNIVYQESGGDTHFVAHFTMRVKTLGSLGTPYVMAFEANEQFDSPSGSISPGVTFFDAPVHSEVISRGGPPNFDFDLGVRVFVVNRLSRIAPRPAPGVHRHARAVGGRDGR